MRGAATMTLNIRSALKLWPIVLLLINGCQSQISQLPQAISTPVAVSPEATAVLATTPSPTLSPMPTVLLLTTWTKWRLNRFVRTALVQGDLIFVSHPPTYTAAFDLNSGTVVWENNDLVVSTPMAADSEHLYVLSEDSVVALGSTDGGVEWQARLPGDGRYHELAAVEEEQMVLYSAIPPLLTEEIPVLYALDAHSGDVLWQVDLPAPLDPYRPASEMRQSHSAIAYDGGRIYLRIVTRPVCCFAILALDAQDGTPLWQFDFGIRQWPGESPSFGADTLAFDNNFVYIPSYLGPLYLIHRLDGGLYGSTRDCDEWRTSLTRVDDSIVSRRSNNEIERLNLSHREMSWSVPVADLPFAPQIAALSDYLFVETATHSLQEIHIAVLNLTSGAQMGTIVLGRSDECTNVLLAMSVCGDHLCLVTTNCIYQVSLDSLP